MFENYPSSNIESYLDNLNLQKFSIVIIMFFETEQLYSFLSLVTLLFQCCYGLPLTESPTTIESKASEKLSEDGPMALKLVKRLSNGVMTGITIGLIAVAIAVSVALVLLKEKLVKRRIAKDKPVSEDKRNTDTIMML
ncbi:unnamed protein product [Ambrosiozyma monospora]|uniref:Unnamed protein product n=1 Tax=Ambrosiozyma monospora TaxID=43982 RepID=A0A9W7DIS3_AMBMO|nr:unnamed protein product [Ambrosiozyma monospora]